jgi:hypothetical protein
MRFACKPPQQLSFLLLVAMLVVVGAASGSATVLQQGVSGRATIGPTCPVERIPPDPRCADKLLAHVRVDAHRAGSLRVSAFVKTDAQGRFRIRLAPGRYDLYADAGIVRLRTPWARAVLVRSGRFTQVALKVDSGIR